MPDDTQQVPLTYTSGNMILDEEKVLKANFAPHKPEKGEQETMLFVLRRVEQEMLPTQSEFHQEWDDAAEIFEAKIVPVTGRPSIRIPWSHTVIDSALAEEVDAFPDIEYDTQEDDDRPKLPVIDAAKKHVLAINNWDGFKTDARRICRIYGNCPVRIGYVRETRKIHERVPVRGDDGIKMITREVFDYPEDDIKLEVIDNPRRFLLDPNCRSMRDAEDCALITTVNWNMFRQKVQHDVRFKNADKVFPGAEYFIDFQTGNLTVPTNDGITTGKRVKILEYWNKALDRYIMIANGIVLRDTCLVDDHKELPFAMLRLWKRPHTPYAKGVPKMIESLESTYNELIGAEVQATKLAFPILTTSDDAGIDPKAVAPYPGIIIEGAMDKMKLEQLGSVPAEVYKLKEEIKQQIIWVSGVNYQQIYSEKGTDRVGIEAMRKESMLSRITSNLREEEADFIVRLGDLIAQDIAQYYSTPRIRGLMSSEDVSELGKLSFEKDGKQLVKDKGGVVRGVMEWRKIPLKGFSYEEEEGEGGVKRMLPKKADVNGYILAKPEYIRTKMRLNVRAIRPSAMGSSKEAKKLVLMELANHALDVNGAMIKSQMELGQSNPDLAKKFQPMWNINYLEKQIAMINDLSVDRALLSDSDKEEGAVDALMRVFGPLQETFNRPREQQVEEQLGMDRSGRPLPQQGMSDTVQQQG